jgi:hypothetical protein
MNQKQLEAYFVALAKKKGAPYAFDVLRNILLPPGDDVHLVAHAVGDWLFATYGAKGLAQCTNEFGNGCSHEVVIGVFTMDGPKALQEISDICNTIPGGKLAYTMCYHGVGHGVLAYTDYDMPQAIDLCKKLSDYSADPRVPIECDGGVVMEMITGLHDPAEWRLQSKKYVSDSDPLSPCDRNFMPDASRPICLIYLTPHLMNVAGTRLTEIQPTALAKAFSYCDQIDTSHPDQRTACFGGFGKEFVSMAHHRDIRNLDQMTNSELQEVYKLCLLADVPDGIKACVNYAVGGLSWGGEWNDSVLTRFCDQIGDPERQHACVSAAINIVSFYRQDPSQRTNFCDSLSNQYRNECLLRLNQTK